MNAPTAPSIWQAFAQSAAGVPGRFAISGSGRHCFRAGLGRQSLGPRSHGSTLTPSLRSGPSQAGPVLLGIRSGAEGVRRAKPSFDVGAVATSFPAISRGQRSSCRRASRLSSAHFFPCRWPAEYVIPGCGLGQVQLLAPWSPLQPSASGRTCRPALRATDFAAFGRSKPAARLIRANCPGGPLFFARF